ncbi:hypothetical protein QC762_0105660 [Podospora pseudocomata]|uniref:F-box domain-containing protein n=1 Tax=Podospora pseudocomata TaxID=2093779 RepID=A0ABR0G2R0_9PEZI|nr:hypothetical protein QC762_0105660 [Podospora pseudocomata]
MSIESVDAPLRGLAPELYTWGIMYLAMHLSSQQVRALSGVCNKMIWSTRPHLDTLQVKDMTPAEPKT